MVTSKTTALILFSVSNVAKTTLEKRSPNHTSLLPSALFVTAITLKITSDILFTKNFNSITNNLSIQSIPSNNANNNVKMSVLSQAAN